MTEKEVRDPCIRLAKQYGVYHKRMHFGHGAANGWPDDLFLFPFGHHFWVEFKGEGKSASPLQEERHREMLERGVDVLTIDNFDAFRAEFFKRLGEHS